MVPALERSEPGPAAPHEGLPMHSTPAVGFAGVPLGAVRIR